ncbi:MAG: hypothetical protein J6V72_17045 [Kiritimatiellae bacterium]|nr:hypothetical protein [Kiritimatiellia bacterium]
MIKQIVSAGVGIAACTVFAAGGTPKADLLGSIEFASFTEFQKKVVDLGTTINNPVVSMMAVPVVQGKLTETFGNFRPDSPMKLLCYADASAIRKMLASDSADDIDNALGGAFIFPCAEDAATFLVNHPEAKKKADGLIELEDGNVVLFAADGRTCAFATDAATAKLALAGASASSAGPHPLVRMDVTEAGLGLLTDIQGKLAADQSLMVQVGGTNATERLLASVMKFQGAQLQRQNANLKKFSQMTFCMDLDETGFVVKGSLTAKPGVSVSPAAGFKLPAGALDQIPAGAPFFAAVNPLLSSNVQNEQEFRALIGGVNEILGELFGCIKQKSPEHAQIAEDFRAATAGLLTEVPYPAPTDWNLGAFAFGPQQEPYLVGYGECAQASRNLALAARFYAAVAEAVGKKWPGIISANGASLSMDWSKLVDVIAAASGATKEEQSDVEQAKKAIAKIVGGTSSEISTVLPSQASYRTFAGAKGFTPPAATPSGERRFAAAVPEVAANRPGGLFYLSLYSLVRDNILPIVMKVAPKESTAEVQTFLGVLPPAGANGAIAGAVWYEKSGSCSFLMRVTKDEIRSYGAAANAVMAVQTQKGEE